MPNLITRMVLFLSSYAPLLVIVAIKHQKEMKLAVTLAVAAIIAVLFQIAFLKVASGLSSEATVVVRASAKDSESMSYIVTYLFPFLDIKLDDASGLISLILLFCVVGILYINSNMIYINPVLNLLGYHLFEVEFGNGKISPLITRREYIPKGATVLLVSLGNHVSLEVPNAR